MGAGCGVDSWRLIAERRVSSAVVVVRLRFPPRACPSQRSGLYRAQRFRAIPTLSGAPHHREEVVQTLVVGMDLDVVAQGGGGIVESGLDLAEPSAQVLRQTSLVERASQIDYLRRRHDVGDVLDSRPGSGEAFLDALGRHAYGFDQLDRAVAAVAEGRVVNELRLRREATPQIPPRLSQQTRRSGPRSRAVLEAAGMARRSPRRTSWPPQAWRISDSTGERHSPAAGGSAP